MPDDPFSEFGGKAVEADPFAEFGGKASPLRDLSQGFTGSEVKEFGKGALKGAGHTAATIGNIVTYPYNKLTKGETLKQGQEKVDKAFQPENSAQAFGQGLEQFAEFFIPVGGELKIAAKAPKWMKLLEAGGRAAIEMGLKTFAQTGDPAASLKAAGVAAPIGAAGKAVEGVKIGPFLKNRLPAEGKAATAELEARGVPLSAGDKTGSKVAKTVEQKLEYVPGSSSRMSDFRASQAEAGSKALRAIPGETGGKVATKEEAGQAVEGAFRKKITDLKKEADAEYDKVRSELAKTRKQTVVGSKQSSILDPSGRPVQTAVTATTEAPVQMDPIRNALKPFYDELSGRLPATVRESSPGYAALRDIVESKEGSVDALKLDRDLSTIKGFLRKEGSGIKDKSGRYAAAVVNELEGGVQKSIGDASPDALEALKKGRQAVRQYWFNQETLNRLLPDNRSPIVAYQRLTESGGRLLPDLKQLQAIAPEEVKTVSRTYAQGLVDDITHEGGLQRLGRGLESMRKLQPEAREILFGKEQAARIENFLAGLKRIGADTNPSGTAKWLAITEALSGTGAALAGLWEGSAAPAAGLALGAVAANRLAKLMTTPSGIAKLTNVIEAGNPKLLSRAVQALAATAQKSDPEKEEEYPTTGVKVKQ